MQAQGQCEINSQAATADQEAANCKTKMDSIHQLL